MLTELILNAGIVRGLLDDRAAGFSARLCSYADDFLGFVMSLVTDLDLDLDLVADSTHESLIKAVARIGKLRNPE